ADRVEPVGHGLGPASAAGCRGRGRRPRARPGPGVRRPVSELARRGEGWPARRPPRRRRGRFSSLPPRGRQTPAPRPRAGGGGAGRARFASYGSTTADGLRALLLCGVPATDERARAAQRWLVANFKPGTHPGAYVERHEPNRMGVYFYYCASLAQAFRQVPGPDGWAAALADDLIGRQQEDGSWSNPVQVQREDDPVTATAFALIALANCRAALAGK